jgi:crotonobetaine/carnitine-CoA ligase
VRRCPGAPLLRWEGHEWSYAQGWAAVADLAGVLRGHGVREGDRVAAFLSNRPEMLWTWFATHAIGAVLVALNREHRGDILADMLTRSRARLLVTERDGLEALPDAGARPRTIVLESDAPHLGLPPDPAAGDAAMESFAPAPVAPADDASIMFTSGTTGRSKAVLLCHNHLARGGARFAESIGQTAADRWHAWMPMAHIFGQLHVTMATLASGGSLALYPRLSVSRFWAQVDADRCTIAGGLGNMLRMLWHAPDRPAHHRNGLRVGLFATPPPELRQPFAQALDIELVDSYGMTEAEPVTVPAPGMPPTSCGRENPDFELAILDDDGRRLPDGRRGNMAIRPRVPDVMFRGYEGDEAATVAAWRDLWFHTGDVGMRDADGFYYLLDRRRHVIRTRGENVSPSELEAIVRTHPDVRDCAAVGIPSEGLDDEVKLVVVAADGVRLEPARLHAFCAERMAAFMVPRCIELREALPYSTLGKIDRPALVATAPDAWRPV